MWRHLLERLGLIDPISGTKTVQQRTTEGTSVPSRGWQGPGGGRASVINAAPEFRGTTVQVCGLWPFAAGAGAPIKGVPLGRHQSTQATVCCDPISWFQRANLISNPSAFILGLPGLGKSTIIRRWIAGTSANGVIPMALGDKKGEHVAIIKKLGGQVIRVGRGQDYLNVLDPGESRDAITRLQAEASRCVPDAGIARAELDAALSAGLDGTTPELEALAARAERPEYLRRLAHELASAAHGRRLTMVASLITIARGTPPDDREEAILDRALKVLDTRFPIEIPILKDLLTIVQEGPAEVREVSVDRGNRDRYMEITEPLEASLIGLCEGGRIGELFSRHTTNPQKRDRPVVYDISSIDDADTSLLAAALLACWSTGFAVAGISQVMAEAGLEPQRHYLVIMDELWKALEAGEGIVDRVNALTRLNRDKGVGIVMASHTMKDLAALPTEEDRMKALGFVERAGFVVLAGLPLGEMDRLGTAVELSRAEQTKLASWTAPDGWDTLAGRTTPPPGRGKFLLKVGGRPGIPIKLELTPGELHVNDTNTNWKTPSRVRATTESVPA